MIPRLQRFYGGPPDRWFTVPVGMLQVYVKMLEPLHAEDQIEAIQAAMAPQAKRSAVKAHLSDLRRTARRGQPRQRPTKATVKDLAGIGIAVREA